MDIQIHVTVSFVKDPETGMLHLYASGPEIEGVVCESMPTNGLAWVALNQEDLTEEMLANCCPLCFHPAEEGGETHVG